ncbi:MAG TPA: tetratricopeptide repeat protein [Chitinophagaceae bacterium]|nr:tetratricopeptide repeat protein [Chitinophagaceae bacterium]
MKRPPAILFAAVSGILATVSCNNSPDNTASIAAMDLKRGEILTCGPEDGELFGTVSFTASIPDKVKTDFNTGVALLHSFEYDEAEKMFAKVVDACPDCAMAYWGIAMANFHPLWAPPSDEELKKGSQAVEIGRSIKNKTEREADYINAIGKFYENASTLGHRPRVLEFEKAMENIYTKYKDDKEANILYALALAAAADPKDKTYSRQKKALDILLPIYDKEPLHPGLAHYIIHNADNPELANIALNAARKYASIAPASAHAQHMPSHIFTRLGYWDDAIKSNQVSVDAAKCHAQKAKIDGHWDEEWHGIDYLVYAYLQKGDNANAKQWVDYVNAADKVYPANFKVAYAFAAVPARYYLENKMWKEASALPVHPAGFPWKKFPWQESITHFARVLGFVNTNDIANAKKELNTLNNLYDTLKVMKDKANEASQVLVQIKTSDAWIHFKEHKNEEALKLMTEAADMEDGMEKHPVTPGEIIPARELLAEMYLQMGKPADARAAFDATLKTHPNRRNALKRISA